MHSAYTAAIYYDAVVAMETAQVVLDPYQAFSNAVSPQSNADAYCEQSFIVALFWWSYANLF